MCELLGSNFNMLVTPKFSLLDFRQRGKKNPDGWGIAWFDEKKDKWMIEKEAKKSTRSQLSQAVIDRNDFRSRTFIAHVRLRGRGAVLLENTHPFKREFEGREVVLAHNGSFYCDPKSIDLKFRPLGQTGSEKILGLMLTKFEERKIDFDDYNEIHSLLRNFNSGFKLNLLFSEGERLYVYRDSNLKNDKRLMFIERKAPFGKIQFKDIDLTVDLSKEKKKGQKGFIIATNPLTTNETWTDFEPESLTVFEGGKIVWPLGK